MAKEECYVVIVLKSNSAILSDGLDYDSYQGHINLMKVKKLVDATRPRPR